MLTNSPEYKALRDKVHDLTLGADLRADRAMLDLLNAWLTFGDKLRVVDHERTS